MPVRTTVFRVFEGTTPINQWVTQYTCPADRTAIVKTVALRNASGVTATVLMAVRRGSTFAQFALNVALGASSIMSGPATEVVLIPGDILATYFIPSTGTNGSITFYASGALLQGVAV